MTMPNFMVIGAAKAGTSALYRYLKQHPQVYMSPKKEPHFFSFTSETKHTKGPGDTIPLAVTELADYQALFRSAASEIAVGEASPTYMYIPGTAERIHSMLPDTKLVAILRQPAARAYSAFMHLVRDGRETELDFRKAIEKEDERIAAGWGPIWHYVAGGHYWSQLVRFHRVFQPGQILVLIYDDFRRDPQQVLRSVYAFLGVDQDFVPDVSVEANVSGIPRSRLVQAVIYALFVKRNPVKTLARRLVSEELRWRFTTTVRNQNLKRSQLAPQLRHELTQEYFLDEIRNLELVLDRDLGAWL